MFETLLDRLNFAPWSWMLPWLFGLSVIIFASSIVVGWLVLIHLPEDYLVSAEPPKLYRSKSILVNLFVRIVRNVIGVGFLILGLIMLFTPGQGVLSMIVGIVLVEFPGKRKLVHEIVAYPKVRHAINKIRQKSNQPPLLTREESK